MNCPVCSGAITKFHVAYDIAWCGKCRNDFLYHELARGEEPSFWRSSDEPLPPLRFQIAGKREIVSTRVFNGWGVLFALLAAGWLSITLWGIVAILPRSGYAPGLSCLIGGCMLLVGFGLAMFAVTLLYCRISLEYCPLNGRITYRKGPFRWWSIHRRFEASEIREISESSIIAGEGEYYYTSVRSNRRRARRRLDFSQDQAVRATFDYYLALFVTRGS